ncbi:MAG: hypothetical protein FJW40_06280 [Acidobacteria bacterium]|nr:hypothetical protein [Acidobacteriota bacterium]
MTFGRRADLRPRGRLSCQSGPADYEVRPPAEAPKAGVGVFEWTGRDEAVYGDCTVSFERLGDRVVLTRRVVRDYYGRRQWPLDEFRAVFREIHDRIEKPEDWKLADLVAELRDRERFMSNEPANEPIDLFGFGIPATLTTDCAALFLLLCQFYLWAHLNELARLLENSLPGDGPTGYIGLYSHFMARVFSVSSAAVAPGLLLGAVVVLGATRSLPYTGLRAVGALASVLLGFGLIRVLRRISKLDEQPAGRGRAATA